MNDECHDLRCKVCFVSPCRTAVLSDHGMPVQKLRTNSSLPACTVLGAVSTVGVDTHFVDLATEGWNCHRMVARDVLAYGLADRDAANWISSVGAKYILITSMFTFEQAVVDSLVRAVRVACPSAYVILGGIHASVQPEWHLEESAPDFIVVGEGEETIIELLTELESGNMNPAKVHGLAFRGNDGRIVMTPTRGPIQNLDRPWCLDKVLLRPNGQPRYLERYTRKSPVYAAEELGEDIPTFALYGSRGCPYCCQYCATTPRDGVRLRHMGAERMFRDFLTARRKFGAQVFYNQADTFGFHPNDRQFLEMVRDYRTSSGDVSFVLNNPNAFFVQLFFTRDKKCELNYAFINLLAAAGINVVTLAIETFSQRFNKKIDWSRITPEHVIELCQALQARGIKTDTYLMYGFPDQTEDEFDADLKMAERLSSWVDSVTWHFLTLLPGTGYYDTAVASGRIRESDYRKAVRNGYSFFYPTDYFNLSRVNTKRLKECVAAFGPAWV